MLQFDEKEHKYTLDGKEIPSVTTILGQIIDFSMVPAARLEAARQRGNAVHKATELFDLGTLDHTSIHEKIEPYLAAYGQFLIDSKYKVEHIEKRIYSEKYGYAGTLDRAGRFPDSTGIVDLLDIKSAIQPGASWGPQLAAYETAFCELYETELCRVFSLRLNKDGKYKLDQYKDRRRDMTVFLSCLNIFNYMRGWK